MLTAPTEVALNPSSLYFVVAPHIVQDLGLNLYTTLPRVLAEFVANAHDADSPDVDVRMDFEAIRTAREALRAEGDTESTPLAERELPSDLALTITDNGHGMSREEVQERFLIAGRRRRVEEDTERSPGKRILMGRKGLGKLAGFGVAKRMVVTTRRKEDDYATRIVLDYDSLTRTPAERGIDAPARKGIEVPTEEMRTDLPPGGTEIVLSRLVFEPVKSQRRTIEGALANHFRFVVGDDFTIKVNGDPIPPAEPSLEYEWPEPGKLPGELVSARVDVGDGKTDIRYRVRFTKKSLVARDRGVRIYASGRLAAAPDLLGLGSGMHGFRLTDYIDAIAVADFIDQQPTEYIATDRRSLRWDTYFLSGLKDFLTAQMKAAVVAYQGKRDKTIAWKVRNDKGTKRTIAQARLSAPRRRTAMQVAIVLAKHLEKGLEGEEYSRNLDILTQGLGQGTVLQDLANIASGEAPGLRELRDAVLHLVARETSELARFAEGRMAAIEALKKIVEAVDFRASNREKDIQELFESAPWLIDSVFTRLVTANKWLDTTYQRLAKHLGVREFAEDGDRTRADLVFLVSTGPRSEITIVELKAANEPLIIDHLLQLERYMRKAERFLAQRRRSDVRVRGMLIGSRDSESSSEKVADLDDRIAKFQAASDWRVRDLTEVLDLTERAHADLIEIYREVEAESEELANPARDASPQ